MLAKKTSKNQITLPKKVVEAQPPTEYFDVTVREGEEVLRAGEGGGDPPWGIHGPDRSLVSGPPLIYSHLHNAWPRRSRQLLHPLSWSSRIFWFGNKSCVTTTSVELPRARNSMVTSVSPSSGSFSQNHVYTSFSVGRTSRYIPTR